MPLIQTKGAASAQGFGEFSQSGPVTYIEDVFSTYLYTGNGSTQTITNNIDTTTYGGLVWIKGRSLATAHALYDTARGATFELVSNTTAAQTTQTTGLTAFNSNGFSIGALAKLNTNAATYASWTFRKQAKFFDIVTWTGDGTNPRTINHNLGSTPGCIIIKCTSSGVADWPVWHRSLSTQGGFLNTIDAFSSGLQYFGSTVTSTTFSLNSANVRTNASGSTYVAYLFAHDAGGFGLTGSDNVISCGSFTTDGSGIATVNLGYEPQWLLVKNASSTGDWYVYDNMRGLNYSNYVYLSPNLSSAEGNIAADYLVPTATGFQTKSFAASATYIYIAIRRGPMKTPTSGTSVFSPVTWTGNNAASRVITTTNLSVPDVGLLVVRNAIGANFSCAFYDRLRTVPVVTPNSNQTEAWYAGTAVNMTAFGQGSITLPSTAPQWNSTTGSQTYVGEFFSRAPGFCDVVCYTGTGSATTFSHNLTVVPELMMVKARDSAQVWRVYNQTSGNGQVLDLSSTTANTSSTVWNNTSPTASVFSVGATNPVNGSGIAYVAYLFATVPGVSKVGSYTGTGALQTVDCGFTSGARFILIKRTDLSGGWYFWDSARGISSGNDPYSLFNNQAAEVTGTNYVDTTSVGFQVTAAAPADLNASGGTYIFLAIA